MLESTIKFYQEEEPDCNELKLTWKVVNDSDFDLKEVEGLSQFKYHSFGDIASNSTTKFTFPFKIPASEDLKEDFGEDIAISKPFFIGASKLNFKIEDESYTISSNSLELNY